ncbi:chemotaxis protein CheA [Archaeoglobus fulgidus]|uniref:Chemotaxis protein CheA n=1 Tax=Archaeoglobus fulgidus (strain ATCC 49558 / DSM 4304 / JCM 9628 / NBRC 100126 / VC-16) TaxID=224325 RepID=O29222_ARCFU|nr:chemotaxis protein CheA [Archaeoglobus fulgidus]AAB90200.1 chemotaxis histidine kinase (cheA) [Archaeoglobus fulgidus DSM 4304]
MSDEMEEYKQEFIQEAREYLDVMNQNFIKVEKGDVDAINEIFRVAHTIKGMAGFMGYKNLEELCHKLESAMGKVRDGEIEVTEELIDVMLKAVDAIGEMIDRIEDEDSDSVDVRDIIEALTMFMESREEEEVADRHELKPATANLRVDVYISEDCVMKSVRAALVVEALSEVAEVVGVIPDESDMEKETFDGHFVVYLNAPDASVVEDTISKIAEIDRFEVSPVDGETVEMGQAVSEEEAEEKAEGAARAETEAKVEKTEKRVDPGRKDKKKLESIRVNISQLDTIMNLVGELVISKGRLLQIASEYDIPELKEAVAIMDKSITSLQDEIMQIRMVRVERVFSKFPRMVRDLARKLGKKIDFTMEGLETELDRTVLDEISDPLVHLVRNAVDHGIETPEERVAAGKDEVGRIKLAAWREKNNIIIELEDDGRGLDVEKIKQKAIEKGIVSPAEADSMSEDEIKMLIFSPGFSTKDEATEVSGRGVGMDVVKTTVERLGGSVRISSEKGNGTRIRIHLPPTVAIVKSLLVKVANETYAIPISSVVEALYVGEDNWKVIHGNPFLIVRGKLVPAFKLRELFNVRNGRPEREVGIIVEKEGEKYALIADTIAEQQEIVIKPLTGYLAKIKGFSGVTILGDGRVVPILDVSSLLGGDRLA